MRELRDSDNKEFILDKNFLDLKLLKEKGKVETPEDPTIAKY